MGRAVGTPGIRRKGHRWEANIRVDGHLRSKTFPLDTPLSHLQAWRESQRHEAKPRLVRDALGRAVVTYLRTVQHQPDRFNKRLYLQRWLVALGKGTRLGAITSTQVETVLSGWLAKGWAPTTVRHHRTALLQVYRLAYGKSGYNPVQDTTRPKDRKAEARAARLDHVVKVLQWLPWNAWRARLLVLLTTGLPHKQIGQLTPDDWDRRRKQLRVSGRSKGEGASGRILPLSAAGHAAMIEFDRVQAWGPFSNSNLHKRVTAACKALRIPRFRPYDLRHTQGTLLYEESGDLKTVARLLGHVSTKTTERYTQSAWAVLDRRTTAKVGVQLTALLEKRRK